ncbi:MAG: hypothetical protein WCF84_08395 [Anaerolineae bacterium]
MNDLAISTNALSAVTWTSPMLLKAVNVATIAQASQQFALMRTDGAPVLSPGVTPNQLNTSYQAQNGHYYVPSAVVSRRTRNSNVPNVFIDHQTGTLGQGDIYILQVGFDLGWGGAAPKPVDIKPFPLDNFSITLHSPNSRRDFTFPAPQVLPAPSDDNNMVQRLLAQVQVDLTLILYALQKDPNSWFEVRADVHYRVQQPAPPAPAPGTIEISPWEKRISTRLPLNQTEVFTAQNAPEALIAPSESEISNLSAVKFEANQVYKYSDYYRLFPRPQPAPGSTPALINTALTTVDTAQAYYPIDIPQTKWQNYPIYARLTNEFSADPDSKWADSDNQGPYHESVIPNQFYVLPDRYGLAFNPDTGMPAMSALLVPTGAPNATASAAYHVRVRMILVPWLDLQRLQALRDHIRKQEGVPYADLQVGGFQKATFNGDKILLGLGSTVVGGGDAAAGMDLPDAAHGFELVLDCTLEMYTLLAQLLTTDPSSIEGNVTFTIDTATKTGQQYQVPVKLRLDQPASHPLSIQLPDNAPAGLGPTVVMINNPASSQVTVTVGRIAPTLLFMDQDMPYPVDQWAGVATPAQCQVEPGAKATIALAPDPQTQDPQHPLQGAPWGAVEVSLEQISMNLNPAAVLSRVHELAASASINTEVSVQSFLLAHPDLLHANFPNVYGLDVELWRGSGQPIRVTLTTDKPGKSVNVAFSLQDIVQGASPDQPTFNTHRRNLTTAGAGAWSATETVAGRELFVEPSGS